MRTRDWRWRTVALLIAAAVPFAAAAQSASDRWSFAITPYIYLPNIDGTLKYSVPPGAAGSPEAEVGPNDYLSNLDFALMLAGEARKGPWSVFADVVYLDFSSEDSSVRAINFGGSLVSTSLNASTSSSLKGLVWTVGAGYTFVQSPAATLDGFGGFRYFGVEASTNWRLTASVTGPGGGTQVFPQSGSISEDQDLWDVIAGVRGRVRLGASNWYVPYYFDIGTGSSTLTWQGLLGIAYGFRWGDVVLAYRHLFYDQKDDKLLQDMRFSGPALGVTFRF